MTVEPEWDQWVPLKRFLRKHRKGMAEMTIQVKGRRLRFAMRHYGLRPDLFRTKKTGKPEAERYLDERLEAGVRVEVFNQDLFLMKNLASFNRWTLDIEAKERQTEPNPNPMSEEEVLRVLQHVPGGHPDTVRMKRALAHVHLLLGLRPAESSRVDVDDLDLTKPYKATWHVRHPAKKGRPRLLPLPAWLLSPRRPYGAYLRWRLSLDIAEKALWVVPHWTPEGFVYMRISPDKLRAHLAEMCTGAGVKGNATRMRHTVGTRLALGSGIEYAAYQLGHRSIETTRANYVKMTVDDMRKGTRGVQVDPFTKGKQDDADAAESAA